MFLFNIIVLGFKKPKLKTPIFGQKGGCNKTVFFMNLCFAKCEKLSFWGANFWQILVDVQKHYKISISALFLKQNKEKGPFFKVSNWSKSKSVTGPSWGCQRKANLDQLLTLKICARIFLNFKKCAETPIFIVLFDKHCFEKKLGPVTDFEKGQTWTNY